MRSLAIVFRELWANHRRLWNITLYDNKAKNSEMVLGRLWNFLNPALQILVYWFVFTVGFNQGPVEGIPYPVWLTCGILPWMYVNTAMINSSNSIAAFSHTLESIAFPLSLVPVKTVLGAFLEHLYAVGIMLAVSLLSGVRPTWHMLELAYWLFAGLFFLTAFALIASSITAVFRDFQRLLLPILRLLFYVSYVVWRPGANVGRWTFVMRLNPLAYLIDGYRCALLYGTPFWGSWRQMLWFWAVSCGMMLLGAVMHVKLRERFIDMV